MRIHTSLKVQVLEGFACFVVFYINEKVNGTLFLLVKVEPQITVLLTSCVDIRSCV